MPKFNKEDSGSLSDKSEDLFDSPGNSRSSTPSTLILSDTEITPSQKPSSESTAQEATGSKRGHWVQNFTIPWEKFPKALLEACKRKVRPSSSDRREMVRILCDEIHQQCPLPGRKNLSKIAEMVVEKYSESFCDSIGDTILGTGYGSLRKQMEERLFNENRKAKKSGLLTRKLSAADDDDLESNVKSGKKPTRDSYGCINWQPDSFPENESEATQQEKQKWLIEEFRKKNQDNEKVALFMKQTYASQRLLINRNKPKPPSIAEIKDQWPFLFEMGTMLQHFEDLMGFDLKIVLQQSLEEKASVIYDFMKQEYINKKKLKESLLEIDTAMAVENSKIPQMSGVYLLLLRYFGEQEDLMIRCFEVSKRSVFTDFILVNNNIN